MKGFFLSLCALIAVLSMNANALELQAYKSTSSSIVKISDASVNALWVSANPACLKDGSKILGVNKAFVSKRLGYRDCSASDTAKEKARMGNYTVTVVKFTELSDTMAKSISKN
jgi:hypothetical protein